MSVSDPVADFLTRIRNAVQAKHRRVDIPASNVKEGILKALLREGYIENYKRIPDTKQGVLRVYLRYDRREGLPVLEGIKRVSTPGHRVYANKDSIPRVLGGLGTAIISTSSGVLTDKEARRQGVGGEILAQVW